MVKAEFKFLTNIKGAPGEKGEKGDTGTFASVDATTLPPGSQATAVASGPQTARHLQLGIPAGVAGASSAPTDQAIAEHLLSEFSLTHDALDSASAALVDDETSKLSRQLAKDYGPHASYVVPVETWLVGSEKVPTIENGIGPAATRTILQRAIDQMNAGYLADGVPRITKLPGGTFDIGSGSLLMKSGAGFWGAGEKQTIFRGSTGNQPTFARGESITDPWEGNGEIRHLYFRDFTVDGSHNPGPEYMPDHKGFRLGFTRDTVLQNVTVADFLATGFGIDNAKDTYFVDCKALRNGRGMLNNPLPDRIGAGSGFGIGVGPHAISAYHMINCVAIGNGSNGFFFETLDARKDSLNKTLGVKLVGCYSAGNTVGICDAGGTGMSVVSSTMAANAMAGFRVGTTHTRMQGGEDGIFQGNLVVGNEVGIQLDGMSELGYSISDNTIIKNLGSGIYVPATSVGPNTPWPGRGVVIRGNKIKGNGSSGMLLRTIAGKIYPDLTVADNDIRDNGVTGHGGYTDGITLAGNFGKPRIVGNRITGNPGRAIALRGTEFVTIDPRISGNDMDGSYGGGLLIQHTVENTALIKDNIAPATAQYINQIVRPIPAYFASSGWARSGVAAGAAAPANAFMTDASEGPVMKVTVDTPGDGTGLMTLALTPDTYVGTSPNPAYLAMRFKGPAGKRGIVAYRLNNGGNNQGYRFICTGEWQTLPLSLFVPAAAYQLRMGAGLFEPEAGDEFYVGKALIANTTDRLPIFTGDDLGAWSGAYNDSLSTLAVPA